MRRRRSGTRLGAAPSRLDIVASLCGTRCDSLAPRDLMASGGSITINQDRKTSPLVSGHWWHRIWRILYLDASSRLDASSHLDASSLLDVDWRRLDVGISTRRPAGLREATLTYDMTRRLACCDIVTLYNKASGTVADGLCMLFLRGDIMRSLGLALLPRWRVVKSGVSGPVLC